jgi:deoxyribodipyrimidine photo-lyase
MTVIVWFRQDLRLADNPALKAAIDSRRPVLPVFIFAPEEEAAWAPGGASRWWLHQSLASLGRELQKLGAPLILRRSQDSLQELTALARRSGAAAVYWNRRYEPAAVKRDGAVKSALRELGLQAESFNGALLREPWEVSNQSGSPFRVFTPFWRHCLKLGEPEEPIPAPRRMMPCLAATPGSLEDLSLLPRIDWAAGMRTHWQVGARGAQQSLARFLDESYEDYSSRRDRPELNGTSRLSPHLHFGELSPRQVWHALRRHAQERGQHSSWRQSQFASELGWREFAHHLLFHYPEMPEKALVTKYQQFPWKRSTDSLQAWQQGLTGYPIVDAGMRQLWHLGWMHNRVRMIVGSFLVKDLLLSWTSGARWFWDTLVDADLANNSLGWQWIAGCGADAAPYFRIFNPVSQATRFDPNGTYVRECVPELAAMPEQWIHQPWAAPPEVLNHANVQLGNNYPGPLVEHAPARERALAAFAKIGK